MDKCHVFAYDLGRKPRLARGSARTANPDRETAFLNDAARKSWSRTPVLTSSPSIRRAQSAA